jgi:hypothetical protein
MLYQGRLAETEPWLERAERTLRIQAEPAAGLSLRYARAARPGRAFAAEPVSGRTPAYACN